MKNNIVQLLFVLIYFITINLIAGITTQDDTVKVAKVQTIPVVDAIGDDACWQNSDWQSIDQVWIDYGETMEPSDFTGQYKVVWSSSTNLLYFLVEVVDDAFVDGWPSVAGDYYHFDIVEVFIDSDKSGGEHIFDANGTNAENAFSYHINIDLPDDGTVTTECVVNDIAGTGWGSMWNPNYADHFPEIALREMNGKYYWEFSLIVFDDTYDHGNPADSRVELQPFDIIGLSMAYCDNDGVDENPKTRDNFIGSVWVPAEEYNDHWMNADGYGTLMLVESTTSVGENNLRISQFELKSNYPNPFNPETVISYKVAETEHIQIKIYDLLGREVVTLVNETKPNGSYKTNWNGMNSHGLQMPSGIYFYVMEAGHFKDSKKMTLLR